jgi:hypothetical protein
MSAVVVERAPEFATDLIVKQLEPTRQVDHRVKSDSAQSHRISATITREQYKITSGTWHSDTSWLDALPHY